MSNITVSKKTALKLKVAGWVKECAFCYTKTSEVPSFVLYGGEIFEEFLCEAPTFQELWDELPSGTRCEISMTKDEDKKDENVAEALVELWIN